MHVVSCYPSFLDQAASIVYCTVVARLWSKVVLIQVEDYLDLDRCKAICEQLCSYMPRIEYLKICETVLLVLTVVPMIM